MFVKARIQFKQKRETNERVSSKKLQGQFFYFLFFIFITVQINAPNFIIIKKYLIGGLVIKIFFFFEKH